MLLLKSFPLEYTTHKTGAHPRVYQHHFRTPVIFAYVFYC